MTKKDYIKFADMIAEEKAHYITGEIPQIGLDFIDELNAVQSIQESMIELFKSDNPSFDEDRFNQYIEQKVKSLLE